MDALSIIGSVAVLVAYQCSIYQHPRQIGSRGDEADNLDGVYECHNMERARSRFARRGQGKTPAALGQPRRSAEGGQANIGKS